MNSVGASPPVYSKKRKTKKSNNNGWRILKTYVPLPLNGWTRP
jgi:hypothetical protein